MEERLTYKSAGVDVHAGYDAVARIKKHVARTAVPGVLGGIGDFGGMFELPAGYRNPVLVSGTDGVGTKLQLAFMSGVHNTVGIDCVAMCANDIICQGAKPLFFLDYIGCGKMEPAQIEEIVAGVAEGCVQSDCALSGGETAEMPGFYQEGEYDLAGFCVGIVEKENMLQKSNVKKGDILIGIPSSGLHSNGFSLVRKLFFEKCQMPLSHYSEELGKTLQDELLTPTRIYVKTMLALLDNSAKSGGNTGAVGSIHGAAHITGGGFIENIPRMMQKGLAARIKKEAVPTGPIFQLIAKLGKIEEKEMFNTFNMGIGLALAVSEAECQPILDQLKALGEKAVVIGDIVENADDPILFV